MSWRRELSKLRALFRQPKPVDDLEEEVRSHLELEEQENQEAGMSPEEAHYAALRRFGNVTLAQERSREMWGWNSVEALCQDLRYGLRQLRRSPGFTAVAVITLALGIGANTAIFSLIDAVLLKTLPVKSPGELVLLGSKNRTGGETDYTFYYPVYQELREQTRSFMDLAAFADVPLNVRIDGVSEPTVPGELVSGSYFSLLGIEPAAGRNIIIDDDRLPGQHPVAMISYGYWKRRLALAPAAIGKTIQIDGTPFTIIGVTPSRFLGLEVGNAPDIMVPVMMQPQVMPEAESWLGRPVNVVNWLHVVGRLKPGVTRVRALASTDISYRRIMAEEAGRIDEDWAKSWLNEELVLAPGSTGLSELGRQFSRPLFILMVLVGLLLLIACTNVANLLLARAGARRREIAVRLAIGAGAGRLIRQLLTESLLLATVGGAGGLTLSSWATEALVNFMSTGRIPIALNLRPDSYIIVFTLSVSLLTVVLFGLVPALRATQPNLTIALRTGANPTSGLTSSRRTGRVLVVTQIAMLVVLVVGAGLFVRSLKELIAQDAELQPERVLLVRLEPKGSDQKRGDNAIRLNNVYSALQARVQAIPGVRSVSLAGANPTNRLEAYIRVRTKDEEVASAMVQVFPRYFATLGIPVLYGRDFTLADMVPGAPYVAVINETLARQAFRGKNPLGRQFEFGRSLCEVIGVVKDTKYGNFRGNAPSVVYQPFLQANTGRGQMVLHVRVAGKTERIIAEVQREIQAIDPNLPAFQIETLATELNAALANERLMATLSTLFGLLALALMSIGLYGTLAYVVTQRTAEIGLRLALGARRGQVLVMTLRQALLLAAGGLAIGIPVAAGASWLVASELYEVRPADPAVILTAALLIVAVTGLAGYIPARRATKVDPMVALRYE